MHRACLADRINENPQRRRKNQLTVEPRVKRRSYGSADELKSLHTVTDNAELFYVAAPWGIVFQFGPCGRRSAVSIPVERG
jgi:hypothetical protein